MQAVKRVLELLLQSAIHVQQHHKYISINKHVLILVHLGLFLTQLQKIVLTVMQAVKRVLELLLQSAIHVQQHHKYISINQHVL